MQILRYLFPVAAVLVLGQGAVAETVELSHGGDTFLVGPVVNETVSASGDAFVAARNASALGSTQGDMHVTGFDVSVGADAAEDVYAFGATRWLSRGRIGGRPDRNAGFSVRTESFVGDRGQCAAVCQHADD